MKRVLPLVLWLVLTAMAGPSHLAAHWESALIVFAAMLLVPLALRLLGSPNKWAALPLATLLGVAYAFPEHPAATWLASPYVAWAGWHTGTAVRRASWTLAGACRVAAQVYWLVGAVWAWCFLAGVSPLGFDPTITNLTAAHFHVAGLVLTTSIVCMLERRAIGSVGRLLGGAALLGMPVVALGIVATQFGFPPYWETVAGSGFAVMALIVAGLHIRFFVRKARFPLAARRWWLTGGLSLLAGAALAALYALRVYVPLEGITISNMKIWHGTVNTVGFGWCTLWGWKLVAVEPNGIRRVDK